MAFHDRVEGALVPGAQALDEPQVLIAGLRRGRQQHQQRSLAWIQPTIECTARTSTQRWLLVRSWTMTGAPRARKPTTTPPAC